jgi:NAD(P)-dependent dehydrogenase (short-subunit alcohol dehydrogenase family)
LVTGCSSGIGPETLRVLVLRGARVYGLAPTLEKAESGCAGARGLGIKGSATPFACHHTDFSTIVACADAVLKRGAPIDMFICNAGVNLQHLEQVNGIEKDFVINHLGHFILVNRLLNQVKVAPQGRIVVVGSGASVYASAAGIEFDNLSGERDYDFMKMYGQSKLANGLFARELARRLKGTTTTANEHDSTQMSKLLHGEEREVFGDQAYWNESHRQTAKAVGIRYRINRRPNGRTPLSAYQRWINRRRSAARARVEHVFHVVKRLWGFSKVRYRGLAKNTARLYTSFALANLYTLRHRLLPSQWSYAP